MSEPPEESPEQGQRLAAIVQEADSAERVVVLKVREPGLTSFVIVGAARSAAGAGIVAGDLRRSAWGGRLPPGAVRQRPREDSLTGARLFALTEDGAVIDQRGDLRVLVVRGGRVVIADLAPEDAARALADAPFVAADAARRAEWTARGEAIVHALAAEGIDVRRAQIVRALERGLTRIARRQEAIRGDLGKIADADRIAAQAQWLVGEAKRAPRGATKLVVTDWSTGEAVPLEILLDPARSASEQVEAMFKRAKRLRLGARVAEERLDLAETQAAAVRGALDAVLAASDVKAIDEAALAGKRAAPRDVALDPPIQSGGSSAAPPGKKPAGRVPYRTFFARSGRRILVGKGAKDNDALTLHVARPHDLWLHAKDRTGAHVIVQLDKGQTCPSEDLVDAAHLAAHFSDARDETGVDVQYTPRRYLRKPKGSPPGLVLPQREKILALRLEADVLRGLLEREEL